MPTRFRELISNSSGLLLPGCHDSLSAKLAERAGFPAVYMSGSAVSAALLGEPDLGLITASEMLEQARKIVQTVQVPVICDADTGYGNPLNVRRTVREFEQAGAAGLQLEDQTFPKRCGHFNRKEVIRKEEMVAKITAAVDARVDPNFVLIARTDARATLGLEHAIERAMAYRAAGADVIFVEAPQTVDELRQIGADVPCPLIVNVVEGGRTPQLPFSEYTSLGFRIVLYPTAGIRVVMKSLDGLYQRLRSTRTTEGMLDELVTFDQRNDITGLTFYEELEDRYRSE